MKYNENTCYWCGKKLEIGTIAYNSIATDTITMRNFCCPEHIQEFRKHAKHVLTRSGYTYKLPPYQGKQSIKEE